MLNPIFFYGVQPVKEALRAAQPISRIYLLAGRHDRAIGEIIRLAKASGIPFQYESRPRLDQLTKNKNHQGIIAVSEKEKPAGFEDLLADSRSGDPGWPALFVVLDQVEDPHNLGAVIRTSEAAGAHGVIIPSRRAAGFSPVVAKVSAGALSYLPVSRVGNLRQALDRMKKEGVWLVGMAAESPKLYWELDFTAPVAIIAGAEGTGLRPIIRQCCDEMVKLPMRGKVGSLNVSVSVGLVLYEVLRQRLGKSA